MTKAWEVSTVTILSSLNKQPTINGVLISDLKYTILDSEYISYHDAPELAELHQINPNRPPKDFVAFRPERLAWHETIVAVSTQIIIENEQDMHVKCMALYEDVIGELDVTECKRCLEMFFSHVMAIYTIETVICSRIPRHKKAMIGLISIMPSGGMMRLKRFR